MNKTNVALQNAGLNALTTSDEQREIFVVTSREDRIRAAEARGRKIVFEFMQSDFKGGKIPYWRVLDSRSRSYQSTLSMEGLRSWGVL